MSASNRIKAALREDEPQQALTQHVEELSVRSADTQLTEDQRAEARAEAAVCMGALLCYNLIVQQLLEQDLRIERVQWS